MLAGEGGGRETSILVGRPRPELQTLASGRSRDSGCGRQLGGGARSGRSYATEAGRRRPTLHQGVLLQGAEGPIATRAAALWLGTLPRAVARVNSPNLLFTDRFESGDTSAWSASVP